MKRRILSMLMVLCMMASLFPASTFAYGDNTPDPLPDTAADTQPAEALEAFSEPEELEIPVHEHEFLPIVTEPTCTTQGYTTYTCACGDSYIADYTDALNHPHTIDLPEIPATETSTGLTAGTQCAVCGEILSGCEEIPILQPATSGEQDAQTNTANDSETSTAVTIVFDILPADAEISVYSKNEFGEITEFDPEENGSFLLLPGEYCYTLQADGYTGIEEEKLIVSSSDEPVIISAVLTVLTGEEAKQTEEEKELELQLEDETEHKDSKEATIASGTCGDNLRWLLDDKGILTISGTGRMFDYYLYYDPWKSFRCNIITAYIEDGVTSIGDYAFNNCTSLTSITILNSVTSIGDRAFSGCSSLTNITIPNSVTRIEYGAFETCTSLTSITIPNSVTSIGHSAFSDCSFLEDIRFLGNPPTIGSTCFNNVVADVYYPAGYGWNANSFRDYGGDLTWHSYSPVAVSSVNLNKTNETIISGNEDTLRARVLPADATEKSVTWVSSDEVIATVYSTSNTTGVVVAKSAGKATITAIARNGKKDSCNYQVLFSDVYRSDYYYFTPVYWALDNGITSGTSPLTFSPSNPCTRGQIVTFLWKAMGSPEPGTANNPFTDVSASDYFYKPVLWAKENGITSGKTATTFEPYSTCTRGQIVTFLWKAMGSPEPRPTYNPFTDVSTTDYFFKPILWANDRGITSGTSATTFSPFNPCTRAQAMTFLYKAIS